MTPMIQPFFDRWRIRSMGKLFITPPIHDHIAVEEKGGEDTWQGDTAPNGLPGKPALMDVGGGQGHDIQLSAGDHVHAVARIILREKHLSCSQRNLFEIACDDISGGLV